MLCRMPEMLQKVEWKLTVNTDGALVTTEVVPILPLEGNPIGLLLTLTYAADQ